jgi:hypothetical protein
MPLLENSHGTKALLSHRDATFRRRLKMNAFLLDFPDIGTNIRIPCEGGDACCPIGATQRGA